LGSRRPVHPYIPNSVPAVKEEMLREIGVASADELYAQMIPERLRLRRRMELPEPLPAELDLKRRSFPGTIPAQITSASSEGAAGSTSSRRSATRS
jgi:hypothetical protein